jgi:hypothetical protein
MIDRNHDLPVARQAKVRIPIQSGHRTDLMPATIPK